MSSNRQATVTPEQKDRFTLFPKLPPELRTKIWDEVCLEPRIVGVEVKDYHDSKWVSDYAFLPRTSAPAVLHACTEARKHGLKYYTRVFQYIGNRSLFPDIPNTFIYLNRDIDTLYILPSQAQVLCPNYFKTLKVSLFQHARAYEKNAQLIQRLALPMGSGLDLFDCALGLQNFRGLMELVLVCNWENEQNVAQNLSSNNQCPRHKKAMRLLEPTIGERAKCEAASKKLRKYFDDIAHTFPDEKVFQPKVVMCKRLARI
jgi:hypothetical protein